MRDLSVCFYDKTVPFWCDAIFQTGKKKDVKININFNSTGVGTLNNAQGAVLSLDPRYMSTEVSYDELFLLRWPFNCVVCQAQIHTTGVLKVKAIMDPFLAMLGEPHIDNPCCKGMEMNLVTALSWGKAALF